VAGADVLWEGARTLGGTSGCWPSRGGRISDVTKLGGSSEGDCETAPDVGVSGRRDVPSITAIRDGDGVGIDIAERGP